MSTTDRYHTVVEAALTKLEMEDIISSLAINKATRYDMTSHKVLKSLTFSVNFLFSFFFNKYVNESTFPNRWKEA